MDVCGCCQAERQHFVEVCADNLKQSFDARVRATQDEVMSRRAREASAPEVALTRQRGEHDLVDLQRTRKEPEEGLQRLNLARHGPVRHVAIALVGPMIRRRSEFTAEDLVVACEEARGWVCERVGHLKIGFDVLSLGSADSQTGYRDPTTNIRRIEVKGRMHGQPIRLTANKC